MAWKRAIAATMSWGLAIASIVLNILNQRVCGSLQPCVTGLDLGLLLIASVAGGIILADPAGAIYGFLGAMVVGTVIPFGFLALPVYLGVSDPLFVDFMTYQAVLRIARIMLPFFPLVVLAGGLVGSLFGERLGLA